MEKSVVVAPGMYIVAVSGGVDSMALLRILNQKPGLSLVVAHFNHGIRAESDSDERLVQEVAGMYGLDVCVGHGQLGSNGSEAAAREARYAFLSAVQKKYRATAIITAHHQDDELETAIINIIRGTGHRGLSPMRANVAIVRPMLDVPKQEIIAYAKHHNITWHEDATNQDERYLRNKIRKHIMPELKAGSRQRELLVRAIKQGSSASRTAQQVLASLLQELAGDTSLERNAFIILPYDIASEVLYSWLARNGIRDIDAPTIHRLIVAIKTAKNGTHHSIKKRYSLEVHNDLVVLKRNT